MPKVKPVPERERRMMERWAWILDVLFGAILAFAFETLEKNWTMAWDESGGQAMVLLFVALCVFSFFLYDVLVYHFIITRYPYRLTLLSACRYVLDIFMAFLLMQVVVPALQAHPETELIGILVALTLWHFCAAVWHCLANVDHEKCLPKAFALAPHFAFVGIYWLVMIGWYLVRLFGLELHDCERIRRCTSPSFLLLLCTVVLGVSLYRSRQLISRFGGTGEEDEPTAPPTSGPAMSATLAPLPPVVGAVAVLAPSAPAGTAAAAAISSNDLPGGGTLS
jgi:hypothetical protein